MSENSSTEIDDSNDVQSLLQSEGITKLVTRLEEKAGALGELEEGYDLQKVHTTPKKDTTYHEKDPWKYPIDEETNVRLVIFTDGDKGNPKNTPTYRKWIYTFCLGFVCFVVAMGSAIVTGDLERPRMYFGVSEEVIILASVTMFVLGFGFGPLLFAPLSEELGRKPVYAVSLFFAVVFIVPCGAAKNIGTLIICRLIDGLLFSGPMCLIGGSLADIFEGSERGVAMAIFSAAPFLGPVMGPIFGGLLADNSSTWRWVYWCFLIIAGFMYILFMLVVPETHGPTLLKQRAKKLRKLTGDNTYLSVTELKVRSLKEIAHQSLLRPFVLLGELIVFLMTIYMSVLYGLLYMFFFAFPIVYMNDKGWSASKTGIMFIPIGVGTLLSVVAAIFFNKDYNRRAQVYRDRGELPPPELRLIPMMVGCWLVPIGLFIFAWSSYTDISWAGPCFAGFPIGFGFTTLYNPANNYIVDSYQHYAASGLAAKTFVRSLWGASVPLFTLQMYARLGNQWASSLMGFIALACCLIPYLFYIFGARVRAYSKYAYTPDMDKR